VVSGATHYTGIDPRIDPARDRVKDLRSGVWTALGWTGAEIMQRLPRIRLVSGRVDEIPDAERFDVAAMHNVTEHLLDLDGVLAAIAKHLRPNGQLVYNHHNFFAWNGHHLKPKSVADIDPSDTEQGQYLDWAHLSFDPPPGHYFRRGLNRLRLHEVREITERYFDIAEWTLVPSPESKGAGRLTQPIRQRHPELSELELTTQHAYCRATPKHHGRNTAG
jgi:SAM-dependent methyltransferase